MFTIRIGGQDVSALIRQMDMAIETALTSEVDTARFPLVSPDNSYAPAEGAEVIIEDDQGRVFGGLLNTTTDDALGRGLRYDCECVDFTPDLDRRLLVDSYSGTTAGAIVRDWVAKVNELLPVDQQFTANGVQDGPAVASLQVNYLPFSMGMEKLNRLTGYEWYVDQDRDVHFFAQETLTAPVPLRDRAAWTQPFEWDQLRIKRGPITQVRTRVYVRGATYLGEEMTLRFAGDSKRQIFNIGYPAHNVRAYITGVRIDDLGLDNAATGRSWYFNYEGMFLRQDEAGEPLTSSDELEVVFNPEIPIRVVYPDEDLIAQYGVREHVVQDQAIDSKDLARLRGKLELQGKGITGTFRSMVRGWRAGQTFDINLPGRRLTGVRGIVTKTSLQYVGDLNAFLTAVQFEVI